MIRTIFILLILVKLIFPERTCESSYCSFRGSCKETKGVKTCSCVKGFSGHQCENVENFCSDDKCENGGKCVSFPGSFNCICKNTNDYSNCSESLSNGKTVPQNIYLFLNPVVKLNQESKFVLAIEKLGSDTTVVSVVASTDVLLYSVVNDNELKVFKYRTKKQLMETLKQLNLRYVEIPHEKMLVAIISATLTSLGNQQLEVVVKHFSETGLQGLGQIVYHQRNFNVLSYKLDEYCSPDVKSDLCEDPMKPRRALSNEFNVFKPVIERSCGENSVLSFQWFIDHYHYQKTYSHLPGERSNSLRLKPFSFEFDDLDEYFNGFYVVKLIVNEENKSDKRTGYKLWRCFVRVRNLNPIALIKGGDKRKITTKEKFFTLDGSESADPGTTYKLNYLWQCTSSKEFCNTFKSTEPIIKLSSKHFKAGETVEFKLMVRSGNSNRVMNTTQEIEFVNEEPPKVWIECIKNCLQNVLIDEIFHARVVCDDCDAKQQTDVKWVLNSNAVAETSDVVILPNKMNLEENTLAVVVDQAGRTGKVSMMILPSYPPTLECKISPQQGIEFITFFTVDCSTNIFEVYQEKKLIEKFYARQGQLRLLAGDEIQIKTHHDSATETTLTVHVNKLEISSVNEFISGTRGNLSLEHFISSNDIASAGVMIKIAASMISEKDEDLVTNILNEVLKVSMPAVESVIVIAESVKLLSEKNELNHKLRSMIGNILDKIANALNILSELSLNETKTIAENIQVVVEKLTFALEVMNIQETPNVPIDERFDDYADYDDFDGEIIDKMNNFLSTGNSIENVMNSLLFRMATFVEPFEPAIEMNHNNQKLVVFAKDFSKVLGIKKFNDKSSEEVNFAVTDKTNVTINKKTVFPQQKIKIGFTTFKSDPFWFVRHKNISKSDFFILQTFDDKSSHIKKFASPIKISHRLELPTTPEHRVCVHKSHDMPTFKTKMQTFSKLIIEFKVEAGGSLKYISQFHKKPQFKDFILRSNDVKIINGLSSFEIESQHNRGEMFIAFLPSQSNFTTCTELQLKFHKISCDFWDGKNAFWTSKFCKVGKMFDASSFECLCYHPGSLTALIESPSVQLDPVREFNINLSPSYIVIGFATSVYIAIILVTCFCSKDRKKKNFVYLKSNRPSDNVHYIIAVTTGAVKYSGTSSHICMEIFQLNSQSKILWLNNETGKFDRKSEWKFVLATSSSFEDIEKISVWIEPGYNCSWYCEKICITEVSTDKSWQFPAQKCFSLSEDKTKIFHEFFPTKEKDVKQKFSLFERNLHHEYAKSFLSGSLEDVRQHIVVIATVLPIVMIADAYLYGTTTWLTIEDENLDFKNYEISRVLKVSTGSFFAFTCAKLFIYSVTNVFKSCMRLKKKK